MKDYNSGMERKLRHVQELVRLGSPNLLAPTVKFLRRIIDKKHCLTRAMQYDAGNSIYGDIANGLKERETVVVANPVKCLCAS